MNKFWLKLSLFVIKIKQKVSVMLSTDQMIPEMLRKLQTTGEKALGKLEESKDKRAEVVEWCSTGMDILGEYL